MQELNKNSPILHAHQTAEPNESQQQVTCCNSVEHNLQCFGVRFACSGLQVMALSRTGYLPEVAWRGLDAACYSNIQQLTLRVALHMDRRTNMPVLKYCWAILTCTRCHMGLFWPVSSCTFFAFLLLANDKAALLLTLQVA